MSKVSQTIEKLRDSIKANEADTLPKGEVVGMFDAILENLPQAAAMDEQQLDIFVAYMKHLSTKMDLLFSATVLCGLGISNDLKVRATIKDMESKFKSSHAQLEAELRSIIDPNYADEVKENREHLAREMEKDNEKK